MNISENIKFQSKEWRVKSVVGREYRICFINGSYYEVHDDSLVLTDRDSFQEAILIAFEVVHDGLPFNEDFCYNGKEIQKLSYYGNFLSNKKRQQKVRFPTKSSQTAATRGVR